MLYKSAIFIFVNSINCVSLKQQLNLNDSNAPRIEYTVIGGTYQKKDATLEVREEDKARIVQGCSKLLPSLCQAIQAREFISIHLWADTWTSHADSLALQEGTIDQVGLRPGRDAIRLEFERLVQPRTGRTLNACAFLR